MIKSFAPNDNVLDSFFLTRLAYNAAYAYEQLS